MVSYGSHLSYIKKRLWRNGWGCCEQCLYGDPILRCYVLNGQTVKKSAEKIINMACFCPYLVCFLLVMEEDGQKKDTRACKLVSCIHIAVWIPTREIARGAAMERTPFLFPAKYMGNGLYLVGVLSLCKPYYPFQLNIFNFKQKKLVSPFQYKALLFTI